MIITLQKLTPLKRFHRKTQVDCLDSWTPCIQNSAIKRDSSAFVPVIMADQFLHGVYDV